MITRECYNCGRIFEVPDVDIIMNDIEIWFCPQCAQEEIVDEACDTVDP